MFSVRLPLRRKVAQARAQGKAKRGEQRRLNTAFCTVNAAQKALFGNGDRALYFVHVATVYDPPNNK